MCLSKIMKNSQIIEILDYWNFWSQDRDTGINRSEYVDELFRQKSVKEVSIATGVRRSGKSTILLQVIKKIIERGTPRENILYVNFEEPAFAPCLKLEFLSQLYNAYQEEFSPGGKVFVVLDEAQLIPQWENLSEGFTTEARI